jgi:hypothetical protein
LSSSQLLEREFCPQYATRLWITDGEIKEEKGRLFCELRLKKRVFELKMNNLKKLHFPSHLSSPKLSLLPVSREGGRVWERGVGMGR